MAEEETLAEEPQAIAEAAASAEAHEQQPQARPESEREAEQKEVSKREAAEVLQDPFLEALLLEPDDYEAYETLALMRSKRKFESALHEGGLRGRGRGRGSPRGTEAQGQAQGHAQEGGLRGAVTVSMEFCLPLS